MRGLSCIRLEEKGRLIIKAVLRAAISEVNYIAKRGH
jgi:hypothetical protein